ncbi:hypothetical protein [Gynuella sunshinyii]|uniref:Uncharacterized protein n=1 Tax=Gynuella sunshinyii YC6258 TaxID=1445510 RepID=A0A0C5VRH9_9GAMM|nr:hypothetical protein [Gynuella sunshinyii]AJQ92864.1 hypothetical Protein YC6258_00814 [Gynuella sunshinyii YC6258]
MELTVRIKGHNKSEQKQLVQQMLDLLVEGHVGAKLENFVTEHFPQAEEALEKMLDAFEEQSGMNLELHEFYPGTDGKFLLCFLGGYQLEDIVPKIVCWLELCGISDIQVEQSWV